MAFGGAGMAMSENFLVLVVAATIASSARPAARSGRFKRWSRRVSRRKSPTATARGSSHG